MKGDKRITREQAEQAIELVEKFGTVSEAARQVGVSHSSFNRRFDAALHVYDMPDPRNKNDLYEIKNGDAEPTVERAPVEVHDASFWKRKASEAQKRLGEAERVCEELAQTNALTSQEQVLAVVECLSAGIKLLLEHYGRIHVAAVPGNHGRTTLKSTAKLYARLSYDIMIANILRERFIDDDRVTFQVGDSKDQIVPLFGRTVFLTHGDKMGTGGGMGFAGPLLPIVRGTKKIQAQQARINRRPDLVLHAHYHTIANPGPVLSNGSVVGYSEYADDIRGEPEPPAQWLFLFHERWGLRERMPILLEDPAPPEKPIVRIPVGMARARA